MQFSIYLTIAIGSCFSATIVQGSLKFAQVFFRHGERVPASILTFPSESTSLLDGFPYEAGELTNEGMWQEYSLGKNLRRDYSLKLLGERYSPLKLRVLSGADNRTLVSAQLVLAAMLPPSGDQMWNPAIPWQPIPVVTDAIIDAVSFGVWKRCPELRGELVAKHEYEEIIASYAELVHELEERTGMEIPDLYALQKVLDTINSRKYLHSLLPLPSWANDPSYLSEIERVHNDIHRSFIDLFLEAIGGWHVGLVVGAMEDFIANRSTHRMVMYSSHDTNILTLSRYLGMSAETDYLPEYGAYLSFELHEINSDYYVEVYFHPRINGSKFPVALSRCPNPCQFDSFAGIGTRLSDEQWIATCHQTGGKAECTLHASISGALLVLLVLLVGAEVTTVWSCCSYRRKYYQLKDPEHGPLLRA